MALLSSTNLVASHCIHSLVLAYLLLLHPQRLAEQNLIRTLGMSLQLPRASYSSLAASLRHASPSPAIRSTLSTFSAEEAGQPDVFATPNPVTALAALFLALYALSDAVGATLPHPCFGVYWATQAMVRLALLFGLEGWIYLSKPAVDPLGFGVAPGSWSASLKTDIVFTWAFVELVWMFGIFYFLRGERRQATLRRDGTRKEADTI